MITPARCAISTAAPRDRLLLLSSPSDMTTSTRRTSGFGPGGRGDLFSNSWLAASGALFQDRVAEFAGIPAEILDDLGTIVEGHQKRLIFSPPESVEQKIDRRILLELQAIPNAVRSVQHHADAERQIGRLAERNDFLLHAVVKNFEILFIQIRDQFFALGHHAVKDVHQVDGANDRPLPIHRLRSLRWSGRLGLLRSQGSDAEQHDGKSNA